jgi:hypothetical protein
MPRDYREEYRARVARARGRGFTSYRSERLSNQGKPEAANALTTRTTPGQVTRRAVVQRGTYLGREEGTEFDPSFGFVPDIDPTRTINPGRPRTKQAGYDPATKTLRIRFREGVVYGYYDVPPSVWRDFRRTPSPGKFINSTLNSFEYGPEAL